MSIFTDIKTALNVPQDDDSFDGELAILIQSALSDLQDVGLPLSDVEIQSDFQSIDVNPKTLEHAKIYILLKTRTLFDTPSPTAAPIFEKNLHQALWRVRESIGIEVS